MQYLPSKSFNIESAEAFEITEALSLITDSLSSDPSWASLPKKYSILIR